MLSLNFVAECSVVMILDYIVKTIIASIVLLLLLYWQPETTLEMFTLALKISIHEEESDQVALIYANSECKQESIYKKTTTIEKWKERSYKCILYTVGCSNCGIQIWQEI